MPVNPDIALQVRPFQAPDATEAYGKILTLKALLQQAPLRAEQLRTAQLENQQRQTAIGEDLAVKDQLRRNPDVESALPGIMAASPKTGVAFQGQLLTQKKTRAELSKLKIEHDLKAAEFIGQSLAGARDQSSYDAARAGMEAAGLPVDGMPAQYSPQVVADLQKRGMTIQQQLEEGHKAVSEELARHADTRAQELQPFARREKEAGALHAQQVALGTVPETEHERLTREQTGRHNTAMEGFQRQRAGFEAARVRREQQQFDATYGALLDPSGKPLEPEAARAVAMQDPIAVATANYQTAPPPVGRGGPGAAILRKTLAINPDYDAKNWKQQGDYIRDYGAGGRVGKTLVAARAALGHLQMLRAANDALKNGDIQILNQIANSLGAQVGGTAKSTFDTIVHRVGPEIAAVYGEGTGGERGKVESDFSSSNAPQKNAANIAATEELFKSKIAPTVKSWSDVMGRRPLPVDPYEQAPTTTAAPGPVKVSSGGKTWTFPSQEKADAFKKAAGIQ